MTDVVGRKIGDLTVKIDRLLCVGFGDCIDEASESFVLDEEGIVTFRDDPERAGRERLLRACEACPVDALSVIDEDGNQIVP